MNVQEQLVAAYKAWEATRFSGEKERDVYNIFLDNNIICLKFNFSLSTR